ncbi:MAG: spermine/spermidine synthase domain-containing protein [Methylotenera sp.]
MTNPDNRLQDFQEQFKKSVRKNAPDEPFIYEEIATLSMHFDMRSIQSVMRKNDPDSLVLSYTRSMMGFLFFQPDPERIAMIGLGGGSLAKYCVKYLPHAHFTAVEINAQVIALREQFKIPADNEKFCVLHGNGADYVANKFDKIDVLLIDGFDEGGHPAKLCSAGFYDNCYAKLSDGGVMVVNLLASDLKFGTYTARMRDSFEDKVVVVDAEEHGNKIAFAFKGKDFPISKETLLERIRILGPKHPIPLHNTAKKILQRLNTHTSHSEWEHIFGLVL